MRILSIVLATNPGDARFPCVAKFDAEITAASSAIHEAPYDHFPHRHHRRRHRSSSPHQLERILEDQARLEARE
ncbi:hypothetical protein [Mesorhizobium delmotii]|uniref:Uncharacterized protein n=1 Tax=Mesorhizobium delmotii TaxID=1631247 RepID=A0A2P9AFT4_9HYPH|nr:hypothetical protein [Mesorhizobium delmotii]SJM29969.1 hypothetical protein BQ8482_120024 [Mesorhizobium delmotii]